LTVAKVQSIHDFTYSYVTENNKKIIAINEGGSHAQDSCKKDDYIFVLYDRNYPKKHIVFGEEKYSKYIIGFLPVYMSGSSKAADDRLLPGEIYRIDGCQESVPEVHVSKRSDGYDEFEGFAIRWLFAALLGLLIGALCIGSEVFTLLGVFILLFSGICLLAFLGYVFIMIWGFFESLLHKSK
jgi:hypothetical protein